MLKAISIKLSESNVSGVINMTECTAQTFITSNVPSSTLTSQFYFAFTSMKLMSKRTQFTKNPSFGYLT